MPCYDERNDTPPSSMTDSHRRCQQRLNHVTELLCSLCATLFQEGHTKIITDNPALHEWLLNHSAHDELVRSAKEKMRYREFKDSDLSTEEREALRIHFSQP